MQYARENPIVAPHSGADFAADFNQLLSAFLSGNYGTGRPANLAAGGIWSKQITDGFEVYLYDGSTDHELCTVDATAGTISYPETSMLRMRLTAASDASLSSTNHAFQIGATDGSNLIFDGNEILARDNGGTSLLNLNRDGGEVRVNDLRVLTTNDVVGSYTPIGSPVVISSAVSSIEFTLDTSTYRNFGVVCENVVPATNNTHLYLQLRSEIGSNWRTSGYIGYGYVGTVATAFSLGLVAGTNLKNTADAGGASTTTLLGNVGDAGVKTRGLQRGITSYYNNTLSYPSRAAMQYNTAEAHDKVRLQASSGDISSGRVTLIGELI